MYIKCPSNRILVIYGKTSGETVKDGKPTKRKGVRCVNGGGALVIPIVQAYAFLDLTPMTIEIKLEGALSQENIRINTPSTYTIAIDQELAQVAATRLLGLNQKQIEELARDIIFGQMRVVIATMAIKEINTDREKLTQNISEGVETELKKVGLRLININIQDVSDASGYIDALGQEAASTAIQDARVKVAEQERKGAVGEAEANKERDKAVAISEAEAASARAEADKDKRSRVAASEAEAKAAEAEADQKRRSRSSEANAQAVTAENTARATEANSNADLRITQAKADNEAKTVEAESSARAEEAKLLALEKVEAQKVKTNEEAERAKTIPQATIAKEKRIIEAKTEAERITVEAEAKAKAMRIEAAAAAEAILKKAEAEAEGLRKAVEASGSAEALVQLRMVEQMPELVEKQAAAIANIQFDKVIVWEGGAKEGQPNSTTGFLQSLMQALPPVHEMSEAAGIELPGFLGKSKKNPDPTSKEVEDTASASDTDKKPAKQENGE